MNFKNKLAIILLLLLLIPVKGFAETVYNQPYLGEFPGIFRDKFSASAWKQKTATNISAIVQQSDLIVLAEAEKLGGVQESSDRITIYEADVKILKVFKGVSTGNFLSLKFQASATGIGNNAKHIFFLKQTNAGFEVLKASYVFPRGQGYDNHMRLFGAVDCSEDVGFDVIDYLANNRFPVDLEERLTKEYLSEDWGKMYSAAHMAFATFPVFGTSILEMAVTVKDRKRFDFELYGFAAYGLAVQQKQENWQIILENIPSFEGYGRAAESVAFDLAANYGDKNTIPVIKNVVSERPELAVSAAFSLSRIGGKEAKALIKSWLANKKLSNREELISNGWTGQKIGFSTLFRQALDKMEASKK